MAKRNMNAPASLKWVAWESRNRIGVTACSDILGCSEAYVYQCGDPNQPDKTITKDQASALDDYCGPEGHGRPYLESLIDKAADDPGNQALTPAVGLCEVSKDIGRLAAEIQTAISEGSENGTDISPNERARINAALGDIVVHVTAMKVGLVDKPKVGVRSVPIMGVAA